MSFEDPTTREVAQSIDSIGARSRDGGSLLIRQSGALIAPG